MKEIVYCEKACISIYIKGTGGYYMGSTTGIFPDKNSLCSPFLNPSIVLACTRAAGNKF